MGKEPVKREIKQERAARTRVDIMDAAITLFARRGYLATTMSELAKAIKMTPGALYWHFPTKEDLLLSAIEELHQRFLKEFVELDTPEHRTRPAREQLLSFLDRTQRFLRTHREYGMFFGMVAAESAYSNDRVAEALREKLSVYAQAVAQIVQQGQQQREFRADVDPVVVGHGLMGTYMGVLVHQNLFRDTLSYDPLVAAMDRLVVDGGIQGGR
jgi:AcrR family transcriptional regulator